MRATRRRKSATDSTVAGDGIGTHAEDDLLGVDAEDALVRDGNLVEPWLEVRPVGSRRPALAAGLLRAGARARGDESVEGVRQREDEVKVRHGKHFPTPRGKPGFLRPRLALRTVAVDGR